MAERPHLGLAISVAALLAACSGGGGGSDPGPSARINRPLFTEDEYGVSSSPRVASGGTIRKGGGSFKLGSPYKVAGRWYVPREEPGYDRSGIGSWYGDDFHGRKTANGEIFDKTALTAAHPTLPMPSYVYVTNLDNGRTILVRVNDRGPYVADRIIDLSHASARALGYENAGRARVRVRYAGRAPLNGDDRRERQYLAQQPWFNRNGGPVVAAYTPPRAPMTVPEEFPAGTAGRWSPAAYRAGLAGKPVPERLSRPSGRMAVAAADLSAPMPPREAPSPAANLAPMRRAESNMAKTDTGTLVWQASPRGRAPETTATPWRADEVRATNAYVDVGSFRQRAEAERMRAALGGLGPVEVAPVGSSAGTAYRVRLGPMAEREARAALASMSAQGLGGARLVME